MSDVTVGFFSWLEDVATMWRAKQLGRRTLMPTAFLFIMYVMAATLTAASCLCDAVILGLRDGIRARLHDRHAARLVRELDQLLQTSAAASRTEP